MHTLCLNRCSFSSFSFLCLNRCLTLRKPRSGNCLEGKKGEYFRARGEKKKQRKSKEKEKRMERKHTFQQIAAAAAAAADGVVVDRQILLGRHQVGKIVVVGVAARWSADPVGDPHHLRSVGSYSDSEFQSAFWTGESRPGRASHFFAARFR